MANRRLFQFRYSYERDVVEVMARITIGAAGAPTISEAKGVLSVVRNSAGNYTIRLVDNFNQLLESSSMLISPSAPAAPIMHLVSNSVSSATVPGVVLQCRDVANAAADPASGETILLRLCVRNAST